MSSFKIFFGSLDIDFDNLDLIQSVLSAFLCTLVSIDWSIIFLTVHSLFWFFNVIVDTFYIAGNW